MKKVIQLTCIILPLFLSSLSISAQNNSDYDQAISEIKSQFGTVPIMFEVFPKHALPGAWKSFKALHSPENKIPGKYRELIQLSVAAQIPCNYCIYFHKALAMANGATEEEVQEAIAFGANTRHWSMVLQGTQMDFEAFKKEFDDMLDYMMKHAED